MATSSTQETCVVVRAAAAGAYAGKQGLDYVAGVSAELTGSRGICLLLLTIPPGARARAHLHEAHETAIHVLSGEGETWFGEGLREYVRLGAGDFFYIPPGVPHLPGNPSATEPCVVVLARTDPNEQESVVLLPELDAVADGAGPR